MKILEKEFDLIAVKDKQDVIKAANILKEILDIDIFRSEEVKKKYLEDSTKTVNNNFLKCIDGDWSIQSHYIGFGISTDNLIQELMEAFGKSTELSQKLENR